MFKAEKKNMIFAIVTPSYNQGRFIEDTIKSVLMQKGNFYIDYTIMDGGSTDETVEIIKKYEKLLKDNCRLIMKDGIGFYQAGINKVEFNQCHGISYKWKSEKDGGQADAINKGFATAKGKIFGFLNSDDVYYQGALQRVSKQNWEKVDFVYGNAMWSDIDGNDLLLYPTFHPDKYSMYYQCTLCQPTVFMRKESYEDLGDFDTSIVSFDYEYWLRFIFRGKQSKKIGKLLAKSRMYDENKTKSLEDRIKEENTELLGAYYSNEKMNQKKLKKARNTVDKKTNKIVRNLNKMLSQKRKND